MYNRIGFCIQFIKQRVFFKWQCIAVSIAVKNMSFISGLLQSRCYDAAFLLAVI